MNDGSDRAFEAFLTARSPALLRLAYLLTSDRGQAEDLVQDVLEKTYLRWPSIEHADPIAYVRRALVNAATNRWRRLGARVREVPIGPGHDRATPDDTATYDLRDELVRALDDLPARQRAVLVLRYWEDLSEVDTAAALHCSVGTVKSQASRGLSRLRGVMRDAEPAPLSFVPATAPVPQPWSAK